MENKQTISHSLLIFHKTITDMVESIGNAARLVDMDDEFSAAVEIAKIHQASKMLSNGLSQMLTEQLWLKNKRRLEDGEQEKAKTKRPN